MTALRIRLVAISLFLLAACQEERTSDANEEQKAYLSKALDSIQRNALYSNRVDWPAAWKEADALALRTSEPAQTHEFLRSVLKQLGDSHSLLLPPGDHDRMRADPGSVPIPQASSRLLAGALGYLSVPAFGSMNTEAGIAFANQLRDRIAALDAEGVCGWVLDLRENGGGNMYPMLTGIGALLGDGEAGRFVAPGKPDVAWWYRDGQAGAGDFTMLPPDPNPLRLKVSPATVAVLTGPHTTSSGEAVAISFRGRPLTRTFGGYTAGLSSANQLFPLDDGALMALTMSLMADRTGQVYGGRVRPDEVVPARMDSEDPTLDAASAWLRLQPACNGFPGSDPSVAGPG